MVFASWSKSINDNTNTMKIRKNNTYTYPLVFMVGIFKVYTVILNRNIFLLYMQCNLQL